MSLKELSEPITKLIETVSKAIGKAFEPRYIRKMADAEAYRIERISDAIRNNSDLPISYNGSETLIDSSNYDEIRKRAGLRLAYQEIAKQENIETIVDKACIELDGKELKTEEEISPEWMNRYINMAGEISTDEMQNIWAKVLAGEVIKPSSYSMRTLECLRNLSVKDAELFSKISNYIISESSLYNDYEVNEKYGIFYDDILALDDCGLINSSGTVCGEKQVHDSLVDILDFDKYVLMAKAKDEQTIRIREYPLTRAGKELLHIARSEEFDESYISDVIGSIRKNNPKADITLHKVISRDQDDIKVEDEETVL